MALPRLEAPLVVAVVSCAWDFAKRAPWWRRSRWDRSSMERHEILIVLPEFFLSLLFTLFLPFSFKFSILFIFLLFFSVSPNTHIYINSNFTFIYEFGRITFSSFLSILDLFFFSITYPIFYLSLFFYSFICHFRSLLFQLEFHLNSNILFLLCTRVSQRTISAFDERMYTSRSIYMIFLLLENGVSRTTYLCL